MKRGKVQLKRIEDKTSRQVCFSKRRSGLFKKARELSILCDVDIALIARSTTGRIYEFSSGDGSMNKILECYGEYSQQKIAHEHFAKAQGYFPKSAATGEGYNVLHVVQRFLEGQIAEQLSDHDLAQLEEGLSTTLMQTRKVKEMRLVQEKQQQQAMKNQALLSGEQCIGMMTMAAPRNNNQLQELALLPSLQQQQMIWSCRLPQ